MDVLERMFLLTNEEEQELAILVEQGDLKLTTLQKPTFVWLFLLRRYVGRDVNSDLIQEGNMGLMKAVG